MVPSLGNLKKNWQADVLAIAIGVIFSFFFSFFFFRWCSSTAWGFFFRVPECNKQANNEIQKTKLEKKTNYHCLRVIFIFFSSSAPPPSPPLLFTWKTFVFFTEPDFSDDWWSSCFSCTPISFLSPPLSCQHKGVLYADVEWWALRGNWAQSPGLW